MLNSRVTIDNVQIVANLNTEPVAENDIAIVDEDSFVSIPVLANDIDAEADPLTSFLVDAPQKGVVVQNLDGSFTYTPNANYFGTDSFTYRANDGEFDSNLATVDITVSPVNDAPVTGDIAASTAEDTAVVVDLLANASDIDDLVLTPVIVDGPANGVLTANVDGTFTYTPNANWFGTDLFTYRVRDEDLESNLATVSLDITSVNDAPQGADKTVTLLEDGMYVFTPEDFGFTDPYDDVQGSTNTAGAGSAGAVTPTNNLLAVKIASTPAAGILTLNGADVVASQYVAAAEIAAGLLQFMPAPDENGAAYTSLGFQVQDDGGMDNGGVDLDPIVRTLTIDVTPVNDAPVATSSTVIGTEDQPYIFNWSDFSITDIESDSILSVVLSSLPVDGQLQFFDGTAWTTASIDQAITQAQIDAGALRFIPSTHESGFDDYATAGLGNLLQDYAQFTYRANDGELFSEIATMTIDIVPVADAPTLTLTNPEDRYGATTERFRTSWESVINRSPKQTLVKATDLEGWTLVDVQGSTSAAGAGSAGAVKAPRPDDSDHDHKHKHGHHEDEDRKDDNRGKDVFEIWSSGDKMLNASTGSDKDDHHRGKKHVSDDFKKSDDNDHHKHDRDHDDGDGDVHGRTSVSGDRKSGETKPYTVVYAAPGNGDNFLELNDAKGEGHQTIGIERTVSTRTGATYDLTFDYAGRVGYSTDFTRIGIYVDDVLIEQYAGTSPNEALNWESLSFSFIGNGGGQTIKIVTEPLAIEKNGRGAMIDNIALIEQLPINTGFEDSAINLSAIAAALIDTDGSEALSLFIESIPVGAVLTDGNNSFTASNTLTTADITTWDWANLSLTPPQDFFGDLVLNAKATATETANGDSASALNSITVTVIGINDAPVAVDDVVTTAEDTPITIAALANDYDADGDALGVSIIAGPQNGVVVLNADGTFSYTPKANFFGTDTFTYQLNDGELDSNVATVTITITPVNDAPTALSRTYVLELEEDDDKHKHGKHDVHGSTGAAKHHDHGHKDKHDHHDNEEADRNGLKIDLQSLISDIEGDPLTLTVNSPANGTLTRNTDGTYRYIPNQGFTGTDSFTYTVSDGELTTTATISIIVKGDDDDHHHKHHDHEENQHDCPGSRITVHSKLPEHDNKKQSDHPRSILVNWPEHDPIIVHHSHNIGPTYRDGLIPRAQDAQERCKIDWAGWETKMKGKDTHQDKDWDSKSWVSDFLDGEQGQSLAEQTGISVSLQEDINKQKD